MTNGTAKYGRMYFDSYEIERYILDKLGNGYEDIPIILTDAAFDRDNGTVNCYYTLVTSDEEKGYRFRDCRRFRGSLNVRSFLTKLFDDNNINCYDENDQFKLTSDILRQLADKIDNEGIVIQDP